MVTRGVKAQVILVRHGTTDLNADTPGPERIRGWLDVPLADKGILQGEAVAQALSKYHADQLWTSGLQRAVDTACMVYEEQPLPKPEFTADEGLRPWNVGDWTGQDVKIVLPLMKSYMFDCPAAPTPGGGESFHEFIHRFLKFFQQRMAEAQLRGLTIICATHTRNLRAADAWWEVGMPDMDALKVDEATMWRPTHIEPGGALLFENTGGDAWTRREIKSSASLAGGAAS